MVLYETNGRTEPVDIQDDSGHEHQEGLVLCLIGVNRRPGIAASGHAVEGTGKFNT